MNGEQDFQIREIKQEPSFIQPTPSKKRTSFFSLFKKKNIIKILIGIIIILILVAVAAVIWGRHSFSRAKVQVDFEAPKDIASGEEVVLTVKYRNNNRVNLYDASLIIDYPSGTFSSEGREIYQEERKLGTILRKSESKENFKVRFVGEKGTVKNLNVKLDYQPQNISSRFENSTIFRTEINSLLIGINIEASEKAISGQEVSYLIKYENKSNDDIYDLKIEITYPDDFEFKNANPEPVEETTNIWEIGLFKSGEKKEINLVGILGGEEGESKILKAIIGAVQNNNLIQYTQSEYITQISPSPLSVLLEIEGLDEECNINHGQNLNYRIEFKNNSDIALRELVLKAYFKDNVFDFREINLNNIGFFDSRNNVIIWSGGEVPILNLLEPNQSGEVKFSVKIKDSLPILSYNDKNFQAKVLAEVETLTVPAKFSVPELKVGEEITCKINSKLDLATKVYYYDPNPSITNNGPIPPRVNQETTYTVHWQITNTSNDLENVKVWTILPQGISWSGDYINNIQNSEVHYNERTNEVTWEINKVSAGIGVVLPVYELIFQIGLTPSVNQVGKILTLINESSAEGKDNFTGITLKDFTPEVDTTLPHDSSVSYDEGRVRE